MRSRAMRCTRSRVSAKGAVTTVAIEVPGCGAGSACGETPPNNAPSPRPNAGFDMPPECRRAVELSKKFWNDQAVLYSLANRTPCARIGEDALWRMERG